MGKITHENIEKELCEIMECPMTRNNLQLYVLLCQAKDYTQRWEHHALTSVSIHAPRGGSDSKDAQFSHPSLAIINKFCDTIPRNRTTYAKKRTRSAHLSHQIRANLQRISAHLGFALR